MGSLFLVTVGLASAIYLLVLTRARFRGIKTKLGGKTARPRVLQFR
jgi:hypothetical protein